MQKDLNPPQWEAVTTTKGPVLILAGAGSGKTRTLTYRIAYLLEKRITRFENILAVTFTNKAAEEMKERVAKLLFKGASNHVSLPWMGTFHSICVKILRRDGAAIDIHERFTIYDTTDQKDAVRTVMKQLNLSEKKVNPRAVLSYISSAKSQLITPKEYGKYAHDYFESIVNEIYPKYQKLLSENNALDFDDLIMKTVQLFEKHPDILAKYQDLFEYIMIDEYQDTNYAQYRFANLLAEKHKNICVVGDDAQSIYSFRGANIENILNFEKDYPEAKVIKLEQNYRSTKTILFASNAVIKYNKFQKPKELWTDNYDGEKIYVYQAQDEREEASWIAQRIKELLVKNESPREIAILYRTNAQSRSLEEAMLFNNINYRIVGNLRFYDRKEVKDIVAYLKVIYNPLDEISTRRIINVPRRGIGAKTLGTVIDSAIEQNTTLMQYLLDLDPQLLQVQSKGIIEFTKLMKYLIQQSENLHVAELIEEVLRKSGYEEYLKEQDGEFESRLENIRELKSVAEKFNNLQPKDSLARLIEEIALVEGSYDRTNTEDERITLMTIHSSKGLEFNHIFVAGMEENLFPHSSATFDLKEMEEERRLAYVAITRAKHNLYLTHTRSRLHFGSRNNNPISRFVEDIPNEYLEYSELTTAAKSLWSESDIEDNEFFELPEIDLKPGDLVKHEIFGVGEVREIDDYLIQIKFSAGLKELALEYARLVKI